MNSGAPEGYTVYDPTVSFILEIINKRNGNTEGAIKNGHSRETGNIEYTIRRKTQLNIRKQTQLTKIRHESSYQQLEIKTS